MTTYDSFVVVDWSAANDTGPRPRKDAIWAGAVLGGNEIEPVYLRNREIAFDWLSSLITGEMAQRRRLMIGFDFPFGYPSGFATAIVGDPDPLRLWDYYSNKLIDTPQVNNRFALAGALNARFPGIGPFWFNGTKTDVPHLPRKKNSRTGEHGMAERRRADARAKGSFTCWQMGGAGSVGGQVMTGMTFLAKLRRRFPRIMAAWPFESLVCPVACVEIWPSLIRRTVAMAEDPITDRAQVRLLARALAQLSEGALSKMLSVDAPEEGWILGLGFESCLAEAAWHR